jgi:hypothetical protein
VCREGALALSEAATNTASCKVWSPADPSTNADLRASLFAKWRQEAVARGDLGAADEF